MEISNCVNKNVAIEKINAAQPKLNAVVTMVDEANNTKEGKLSGVPVALKDNISTCGIRTTASSRILDNYVPVYDATIVKKELTLYVRQVWMNLVWVEPTRMPTQVLYTILMI